MAQAWLQAQSPQSMRSAGAPAAAASPREATTGGLVRAGRVLLLAAAGYEGELAVVALAHIMRACGVSLHQAIVAASQQHAGFLVGRP